MALHIEILLVQRCLLLKQNNKRGFEKSKLPIENSQNLNDIIINF